MERPKPLNNRKVTGKELLNMNQRYWSDCRKERYIYRWLENDLYLLKIYAKELTDIPFDVTVYIDRTDDNLELRVFMDDEILFYDDSERTIDGKINIFYKNWNKIIDNIEYFATQYDKEANNRINEIKKAIKELDIFFDKFHLEIYKSQISASKYKLSVHYLSYKVVDIFVDKYKENVVEDIVKMNMDKIKNGVEKAILFCYMYNDTMLISEEDNNYLISRIESNADIKTMEILINSSKVPYEIKDELLDWEKLHPLLVEEYEKDNENVEKNEYSLYGTNLMI